MRKTLMLATALSLLAAPLVAAGPAFASHYPPQTFANTPDPVQAPPAYQPSSNQASVDAAAKNGVAQVPNATDPMDPDMNPHNLRATNH